MKKIYMDHAATTPLDVGVMEAMKPYFSAEYGNASSAHALGRAAKKAVEEAREKTAKALGAKPEEIIFTSGGTESDNLALKGAAEKRGCGHIITSAIEHKAVLNVCGYLEKRGFSVTYLGVDGHGTVSPKAVEEAIREDTFLISIMHANNEIGTVEPIEEIGRIARENKIMFHSDAVQTIGKIAVDVEKLGVDMLSVSAHKFYGPKGVGALYVKDGIDLEPVLHGGGHERGRRAGTENVPGIVGLAEAIEKATGEVETESLRLRRIRDRLIEGVLGIEKSRLNGHPEKRLPNNAHFSFFGLTGDALVAKLDELGIAASAASACFAHASGMPHVLEAIRLSAREANSSLRLTLGKSNTKDDAEYVIESLSEIFKGRGLKR